MDEKIQIRAHDNFNLYSRDHLHQLGAWNSDNKPDLLLRDHEDTSQISEKMITRNM